ncbi:MAG: HD domain-containing protein [Lachnospiraceae bacterium]|nr:HD domain-containing protein [Lachnospiraceae bacterium]
MIKKRIDLLKGDEILARAIMSDDYKVILPAGVTLKKDFVERLECFGIKEVYIKEENVDEEEVAILREDVENAVVKKVHEILEKHTYQNNDDLKDIGKQVENIMSTILEKDEVIEKIYDVKERSNDIYEHSVNMCALAILTALKMGLEKESVHAIGVGCLLHDIGLRYMNIDCDDNSIDNLSGAEVQEYMKHPVYGYTSVKDEDWLSSLSKAVILSHHERLDGGGFPLKIKDIPIESRIVAVCDVFDEMICGIFCRSVMVHEAIEYLKTFSGIKYDREVVNLFLSFIAAYPVGTRVLTSDGEEAVVVYQNKDFPDRPVIKITRDASGRKVNGEIIKDLVKSHSLFIKEVLE